MRPAGRVAHRIRAVLVGARAHDKRDLVRLRERPGRARCRARSRPAVAVALVGRVGRRQTADFVDDEAARCAGVAGNRERPRRCDVVRHVDGGLLIPGRVPDDERVGVALVVSHLTGSEILLVTPGEHHDGIARSWLRVERGRRGPVVLGLHNRSDHLVPPPLGGGFQLHNPHLKNRLPHAAPTAIRPA